MRVLISIVLILATLGAVAASMPQSPPTTRVENCTTSGCHAKQLTGKFLHAPTAAGACEMCHASADESKHTFTLKHQGAELCSFCHLGKTEAAGLHMHAPVQEGKCTECHSPHGSDHRYLIKGETTGALCLSCHESIIHDRAHVHTPIAQGDCMGCHKAHSSVLPGLLVDQGRTLCLRCHANVEHTAGHSIEAAQISRPQPAVLASHEHLPSGTPEPATATTLPIEGSLAVHEPFKGECTQCHEQHASQQLSLLKLEPKQLCISCHQDIAEKLAAAVVPHSAVTVDRACLNCHAPHMAHDAPLLREQATKICLDCHNKPLVKADGSTIDSMASLAAEGQHLHAPIEGGGCGACHDVHGGAHRALLTQPYTQSFYQPFNPEAYALCFTCHDSKLATEQNSTTATNFRNGEVNLHYVHISAPGDAGRSCRVCHATHSAANTKQVRDSVPFGNWQVPIKFEQTATGGSCAAGCHRSRSFDRTNPVVSEPATP